MYDYLVENPLMAIIFILIVLAIALFLVVKTLQTIGLEQVRGYVYHLFIEAEHEFKYGDNEQKFEYVIQLARSSIPLPFSLVITESNLRKVVQTWFDLCKDLLDDGRFNGTGKEEDVVENGEVESEDA